MTLECHKFLTAIFSEAERETYFEAQVLAICSMDGYSGVRGALQRNQQNLCSTCCGEYRGAGISDNAGLPALGAVVTASNMATNAHMIQPTAESGFFLPVGRYTVTIEAKGFARFTETSLELQVSETARLTITLQLASVTESIEVQVMPQASIHRPTLSGRQ